uniref:long-chain-fatty-acid--CoA ligase n=1 Tax=Macrostomum lignano TaxID=282301 RepID=A0A1I8JQ88_9PLAT
DAAQRGVLPLGQAGRHTVSELGSAEQAIRLIVAAAVGGGAAGGAAVISYVDAIARAGSCFSSGGEQKENSGQPKAVMLTNDNLVKGVHLHPVELNSSDRYFSYLPMAHILERMCQLFAFATGLSMGFFRGDRAGLMDDLRESVTGRRPQVLSRIRERALTAVSGSRLKSAILDTALSRKSRRLSQLRVDKDTLWDRLVFRRVQEGLGGRVRFVAGFGQTETCGLGLCQRPGDPASNHTGRPMLGIEVRLADAPTPTADGRGELCIRGPTCFAGYFKQPERSAETLDSDGWVHTGDIAQLLPGGSYRIVDRVKHLFKLAQGEYIAPEKIELVYCLNPAIDQRALLPARRRGANVGRHQGLAGQESRGHGGCGWRFASRAAGRGLRQRRIQGAPAGELQQLGKQKGCRASSRNLSRKNTDLQVKAILLHPEPFSAENDLMTPTMKLKRPQLRKRFADAFDAMYAEVEPMMMRKTLHSQILPTFDSIDDDDVMIMMMMMMMMDEMIMMMMPPH